MKLIFAVLVFLPFLTGCKNSALEQAMELRSQLLKAGSCSFAAEVTADYGDKTYAFSMDCQSDDQGALRFTVVRPDSIRGISGIIRGTRGSLTFDDTALEFPLLADRLLTPVCAPWILVKTLQSGYITSAGNDGDMIRVSIDDSFDDDALQLDIWLTEGNVPDHADILYRGRKYLSMVVSNFRTGTNPEA